MNAEISGGRILFEREVVASMGPRSYERGNTLRTSIGSLYVKLQWGRVLMNAEITSLLPWLFRTRRFNGAAFL